MNKKKYEKYENVEFQGDGEDDVGCAYVFYGEHGSLAGTTWKDFLWDFSFDAVSKRVTVYCRCINCDGMLVEPANGVGIHGAVMSCSICENCGLHTYVTLGEWRGKLPQIQELQKENNVPVTKYRTP
jgi:hypothetical protein